MGVENSIPAYLDSPHAFIDHRLKYFKLTNPITISSLEKRIFPESIGSPFLEYRQDEIDRLGKSKEDILIVTATANRPKDIVTAYRQLSVQTNSSWKWIVVDNGAETKTEEIINCFKDERIYYFRFREKQGCAFPTRNMGLDIVHLAKKDQNHSPFVIVIDSDDRLFNEVSLSELLKISHSTITKKTGIGLIHGYSATEIREPNLPTINVPNPRDYGSDFPKVKNLKEVFEKGLNILSGAFPIELLSFLRYPEEFSFEDDGLNQKLLLYAKSHGLIWLADNVPTTVKVFHQDSMSNKNDNIGNTSELGKIGLHRVMGIRARIVSYLHDISDYYTKEGL